ncbi:conserved hypothetical protein [Candidatus Sulfopaludibacter sp. SbA3]|nr:conserved hypothetical protein [Candidatus Sulfopaludibacter sp. SbA3]
MQSDDHERARLLIDRDLVEGIMVEDRAWLRSHLAECAECAGHREMTARILAGLKSLSFEAPRRRARWAAWMAAAAALLVAVPVYQHVRRVEAERQDELLLGAASRSGAAG